MPSLNVNDKEWTEAQDFFLHPENQGKVKFSRKETQAGSQWDKTGGHAFILLNGEVWALNNRHLGESAVALGEFGESRIGENRDGKKIFIQVEAIEDIKAQRDVRVEQIMKEKGYLLGRIERPAARNTADQVEEMKVIRTSIGEKETERKVLTAYQYLGNRNLFTELSERWDTITEAEKLNMALRAMMAVQSLHHLGIVHRDLKEENFVLDGEGQNLRVSVADFQLSEKLPEGKDHVIKKQDDGRPFIEGTPAFDDKGKVVGPGYIAREILDKGKYSYATDVYALGNMLEGMDLPRPLWEKMKLKEESRISLPEAMKLLATEMRKYPEDKQLQNTLSEYYALNPSIQSQNLNKDQAKEAITELILNHQKQGDNQSVQGVTLKIQKWMQEHVKDGSDFKAAYRAASLLLHTDKLDSNSTSLGTYLKQLAANENEGTEVFFKSLPDTFDGLSVENQLLKIEDKLFDFETELSQIVHRSPLNEKDLQSIKRIENEFNNLVDQYNDISLKLDKGAYTPGVSHVVEDFLIKNEASLKAIDEVLTNVHIGVTEQKIDAFEKVLASATKSEITNEIELNEMRDQYLAIVNDYDAIVKGPHTDKEVVINFYDKNFPILSKMFDNLQVVRENFLAIQREKQGLETRMYKVSDSIKLLDKEVNEIISSGVLDQDVFKNIADKFDAIADEHDAILDGQSHYPRAFDKLLVAFNQNVSPILDNTMANINSYGARATQMQQQKVNETSLEGQLGSKLENVTGITKAEKLESIAHEIFNERGAKPLALSAAAKKVTAPESSPGLKGVNPEPVEQKENKKPLNFNNP